MNSFAGVAYHLGLARLLPGERVRRDEFVSFRRARIEELPFEDGSFDAVISNGVVNLSADKRRVFAEAARVLRPGGRLALADIVTERQIAARTQRNPGYRFTSERAQRTSDKYGAHSVSLLALKPLRASRHTSHPDLGGGADVAQAASEEGSTNTTTTQEVSK